LRALLGFILLAVNWMPPASSRKITFKGRRERKGGDGRDPTLKNMSELMPAEMSRCWRQNLRLVAQRTQALFQDEEKKRSTCTRPERGEAEEGRRDTYSINASTTERVQHARAASAHQPPNGRRT